MIGVHRKVFTYFVSDIKELNYELINNNNFRQRRKRLLPQQQPGVRDGYREPTAGGERRGVGRLGRELGRSPAAHRTQPHSRLYLTPI